MKELVEKGKILEIKSGSHLYGLNTPTSDEDYVGIFFASENYIYGLKTVEQVDLSIIDKHKNGKNTKLAVDRKFYELKRFVKLASQGNPNIIEILFASEDSIIYISDFGKYLLENRKLFISKNIIPKFLGYARSQKNKLMVKTENMKNLIDGVKFLQKEIANGNEKIVLPELSNKSEFNRLFKETPNKVHYKIGAYTINKNITIKGAVKWLEDLLTNTSNRIENIKSAGWEFKHGSHLLRLLYQTIELCETGDLKYPLKDKDLLLKIKKGEVSYQEFIQMVESAEDCLEMIKDNNKLPNKPNIETIEKLVMEGYKKWLLENTK